MSKIYRSAKGKPVDMGALAAQNETVRAVGNMKVNARGDLIDSNNNIIQTKQQQIAQETRKKNTPQNRVPAAADAVRQQPEVKAPPAPVPAPVRSAIVPDPMPVEETVEFPDDVAEDDVEVVKSDAAAEPVVQNSGLASAIQRAKDSKKQ